MPASDLGHAGCRAARLAQLEDDRLVPARLVKAAQRWVSVAAIDVAHRQPPPSERCDQPVDVRLGVDFGDAVESALAQLGELAAQVLAAEDLRAPAAPG